MVSSTIEVGLSQRMSEADVSSNIPVIPPAEAGGCDRKHRKKRHPKGKRDDSLVENELIQQGSHSKDEVADNKKKHTKKRHHKRKMDDSNGENELDVQEAKKDDSHEDNEQEAQSEPVVTDNEKHTKKGHDNRKKDDPHVNNELMEQETKSNARAADNKTHTKRKYHKRKRDDSHEENELIEQEKQSNEVASHSKKRMKIQNSKSNRVNESASRGNLNSDGGMEGARSKPKAESDRKSSAASKGRIDKDKKTVRFSSDVEVFHSTKNPNEKSRSGRFNEEEDQILKDALWQYIEDHNLNEDVYSVIYNVNHPKASGFWKEIGAALPWRSRDSVRIRAAYIFRERKERRIWTPDEIEIIKRHVSKHGRRFKDLADHFHVHRHHVKDAWRRNRLPNARTGHWSQDEYKEFFELVNEDIKMKAFDKRKKSAMIKENISWWSISDKMATRYDSQLCLTWYNQLTSPLVSKGLWSGCDDYRMLYNLSKLDACCIEDVDWDNLLKHRDGDVCRKRWRELTRQLGGNVEKSFMEQVELLSSRYHIDILPYRKISLSESDSSDSEDSDREAEPENTECHDTDGF